MKKQFLDQTIRALNSTPNLTDEEFYFALASVVMYLQAPLNQQEWNTFYKRVEVGKVTVQEALWSTDEEKNPEFFKAAPKKTKTDIHQMLFDLLVQTKRKLQRKIVFQPTAPRASTDDVVLIPDVIDPSSDPTLFPREYLRNQIDSGVHTNELTGHPLAWSVVEAVRTGKPIAKESGRKLQPDKLLELIQAEIDQLTKVSKCCVVCKSPTVKHKSMMGFQCVFFCSFKCFEKWDA